MMISIEGHCWFAEAWGKKRRGGKEGLVPSFFFFSISRWGGDKEMSCTDAGEKRGKKKKGEERSIAVETSHSSAYYFPSSGAVVLSLY